MATTKKAFVRYSSGLMLVLQKQGRHPVLFLEAISNIKNHAGRNLIHNIIDNEEGVLKIRLNVIRETYEEIAEYINSN